MANDYLQFAGILTKLTDDEEKWLRHALRFAEDELYIDDDYEEALVQKLCQAEPWRDPDSFECAPDMDFAFGEDAEDGKYLRLFAEENGNPWAVGELVQAFIKQFRPGTFWAMTWSTTCDKMRTGHFSGGGVVVTEAEIRLCDATDWIRRAQKTFTRTGRLPLKKKRKLRRPGRFWAMNEAQIIAEQGWSDQTMLQLHAAFIAEYGLVNEYTAYLADVANEEEQAALSLKTNTKENDGETK